jgi:transcriptional regulator with GAF, ATPase, and Fis domain
MKVLLTFTGFHDPYALGLIGEQEQLGPILSLASRIAFDKIVLFSTPNTGAHTQETEKALKHLSPKTVVNVRHLPITDPTDYVAILKKLRVNLLEIQSEADKADYYVAVASGTPQMHACWLLLVAGGELPAKILHVRPPKFVSKDAPLISEVDLTSPEFPSVKPNLFANIDYLDSSLDVATIVKQIRIVGDHPSIKKAIETAAQIAPSDHQVLILGETGTGKELFARLIHQLSGRKKESFVVVNCASVVEGLFESEVFGHKKGAFTGAIKDHLGKFLQADKGTLFLDEIGELGLSIQVKLLRVLQDKLVESVGGKKPVKVDVRIIAATNRDLRQAVAKGDFREDLFYRLGVSINLPPLRERRSDIPSVAAHVLERVNLTLRRPIRLSVDAVKRLQNHAWRGNVRELENVINNSASLTRKGVLEADDLLISDSLVDSDPLSAIPTPFEGFSLGSYLWSVRKQLMMRALDAAKGNQSQAARLLGITPQAFNKAWKELK